ncbi:cryptopain-cysteine proteinase secreted [Cryptosporidium canis]|uniref:Cryptopain-cysteine proteinase secreted n=1 Tax=Cryptosporidium canis TaxID=195482 RepID=A0A9D5DEJ8_9CRYT|nr:cryptopain-cysteine proteinase secreted [Cryptosporidium canis]
MDIGNNAEEHQEYISGPYIALINGTTQRREPNKKLKNIIIATLIAIFIVLVVTVSLYITNNTSDKIDDFSPGEIADPTTSEYRRSFEEFKRKYHKKYGSKEEEAERFEIFKQNMNFIQITNSQGFSYVLEMNEFGDLTKEEFMARFTGYRKGHHEDERVYMGENTQVGSSEEEFVPPDSVNWIKSGCVNPIRNQKSCGSCWAFSAVAALEGAVCAQTNQGLPSLSEQQLVDCTKRNGNFGCKGGTMGLAFQYAIKNRYLCTNDDYPYYAEEKTCKESQCRNYIEVPIETYRYVVPRSIYSLKTALAKYGPVSVAIQADQTPFQFYKSGVFDAPCGTQINHGVVLVGYDVDETTNKEYWLVRNSWGENWGEKGYIKLALHSGRKGTCGILMEPVYPVIDTSI